MLKLVVHSNLRKKCFQYNMSLTEHGDSNFNEYTIQRSQYFKVKVENIAK